MGVSQLDAAFDFLSHLEAGVPVPEAAFKEACGVGVEVTRPEIEAAVAVEVENNKALLLEERYLFNVSALQARASTHFRKFVLSSRGLSCVAYGGRGGGKGPPTMFPWLSRWSHPPSPHFLPSTTHCPPREVIVPALSSI